MTVPLVRKNIDPGRSLASAATTSNQAAGLSWARPPRHVARRSLALDLGSKVAQRRHHAARPRLARPMLWLTSKPSPNDALRRP